MAALYLVVTCWKGFAFMREPTLPLALITSAFGVGTMVWVIASPAGYTALGKAFGQPWIATLPSCVGVLLCYAATHILTLLWTPTHSEPQRVRRTIVAWTTSYSLSIMVMVVTFLRADLDGPADPLAFNTQQADDPNALTFSGVYMAMLTCGTLNTWRRSRHSRLDDERFEFALRSFRWSMLLTFGFVVCSVPAIVAAALGHHQLDGVGVMASSFGIMGCIGTCYGMSGAAFSSWLRESRDIAALQPLWDLVVGEVDESLSFRSSKTRPNRFINVRFTLHRTIIEILDGIRELQTWASEEPAQVLEALHRESLANDLARTRLGLSRKGLASPDLNAAATAVVLRYAAERFTAAQERSSGAEEAPRSVHDLTATVLGAGTAARDERQRLLRVALALQLPIVDTSLTVLRSAQNSDLPPWETADAR
ncbi:DUF6545 domain-containing protein [Streptomyces scabiei]|uniref:DUF6545 domain-containing protein n=1 Tax=Streptomyces scabiei TaxID=1930 RepID=UPI0034022A63